MNRTSIPHWREFLVGGGRIRIDGASTRLILPPATAKQYSDAQLDDYAGLPRSAYPHRPPARLSLKARFSHRLERRPALAVASTALVGTAGFGFWNNPFGAQSSTPAFPQALWFFYASPPSEMALAFCVPGFGCKAACIDAGRASALAWIPLAPLVVLASRSSRLYRALWPRAQRSLAIHERLLAMREGESTDWHRYELEWRRDGACWRVDGETQLETDRSPRGPLGLVAWIDNQYARVTPQGSLRFGLLDVQCEQWLELAEVDVTSGTRA